MSETPGDWKAVKDDGVSFSGIIVCSLRGGWSVIALEENPNNFDPASDATLIAQAPELLNELEILVEEAEQKGIDCQCQKTVIGRAKGKIEIASWQKGEQE